MNKIVYSLLILMIFILIPESGYGIKYGRPHNKKDFGLKGPVVYAIFKDCQFKEEFGEIVRAGSKDTCIYFLSDGNIYKEVFSPESYKKIRI